MTESVARDPWELSVINDYHKIERIGEGTYGEVFRARHDVTNEIVAVKKVKMPESMMMREGFPVTAIREIKILKALDHPNVVKLKEIAISGGEERDFKSIFLIFEFLEHDLQGLLVQLHEKKSWLNLGQIKSIAKQLLEAVAYLHKNNVLHRDIKASNMLINNKGEVKLADFGLARIFQGPTGRYTNRVITLWFRPPELLLGATSYGPEVDVWSVGCIIAELLFKRAILPGRTELDQLDLTFKLCGTPTPENWPGVDQLPYWATLKPHFVKNSALRQTFSKFDPLALDLIESMLKLNPTERITAEQGLQSPWFAADPQPEDLSSFLCSMESMHEYTAKARRQAKREGSFSNDAFSNNLTSKLQNMTLQPSPNKLTNFGTATGLPNKELSRFSVKTSPVVPVINIQGSSPSPKLTPVSRASRSPSPSTINSSLQNSFKLTSTTQPTNPLPPIASQGYYGPSAPQFFGSTAKVPQDPFTAPNGSSVFAQQPRAQPQYYTVNKNNAYNGSMPISNGLPSQVGQLPQASAVPQFSFPTAVPVMFQPPQMVPLQSMAPQPVPFGFPPPVPSQMPVYNGSFVPQQFQPQYLPYSQAPQMHAQPVPVSGGTMSQQLPHAQQFFAAEQAINKDLSRPQFDSTYQPHFTQTNMQPSYGNGQPMNHAGQQSYNNVPSANHNGQQLNHGQPSFSVHPSYFGATQPSFDTRQSGPSFAPANGLKFTFPTDTRPSLFASQQPSGPDFNVPRRQSADSPIASPVYEQASPSYSPASDSDSEPIDDSDDSDYVPSRKESSKQHSEPKGVRTLRNATKVP